MKLQNTTPDYNTFDENPAYSTVKINNDQNPPELPAAGVEDHSGLGGDLLKAMVYGGLDGIITTFATVTSVAGADLSAMVIVIMGIAHLFADGFSMGLGDMLSTKAEVEYTQMEQAREQWEMESWPEMEKKEMLEIYIKKGLSKADASIIIETLWKYPQAFLENMMVEELGLMPYDPEPETSPEKSGLVTMVSFIVFGSIPLLPFLLNYLPFVNMSGNVQFYIAIVSTLITLFILGVCKSYILQRGQRMNIISGCVMMINGSLAATAAYLIGYGLNAMMGGAQAPLVS